MTLNPKIGVFGNFLAIFGSKKVNCNKMDGDGPRLLQVTDENVGDAFWDTV